MEGISQMRRFAPILALSLVASLVLVANRHDAHAAPLVPGTGERLDKVCDDFEDDSWSYTPNPPKSSHNLDDRIRVPGGFSSNGRWAESAKRGQPDVVKRVATPPGGSLGSTGALFLATQRPGIPGSFSWKMQQDDFLLSVKRQLGGHLPVSRSPSFVTRVYLPPFDKWENRSGTSFGLRADCRGSKGGWELESYWPGIFITFQSKTDPRYNEDSARLLCRAGPRGYEFPGPDIKEPGWWTLGMSFTPDGQVHYYAHAGVEALTAADHLGSRHPYGFRCRELHTLFFNVACMDNGRTWSTPWVVDDVEVFFVRPGGMPTAGTRVNSRR